MVSITEETEEMKKKMSAFMIVSICSLYYIITLPPSYQKSFLAQCPHDCNQHDCAEQGDQETVQIEAGNPALAQKAHQPTA